MERYSKNRQAILDCLRATDSHPTAEWLYARLKPLYPSLSLGTVYRNLWQLKDAGIIRSMGVIAGQEHFDGEITPHAHAVCSCCGQIRDLPLTQPLLTLMHKTGEGIDYRLDSMQFTGLCSLCRDKRRQQTEGKEI